MHADVSVVLTVPCTAAPAGLTLRVTGLGGRQVSTPITCGLLTLVALYLHYIMLYFILYYTILHYVILYSILYYIILYYYFILLMTQC